MPCPHALQAGREIMLPPQNRHARESEPSTRGAPHSMHDTTNDRAATGASGFADLTMLENRPPSLDLDLSVKRILSTPPHCCVRPGCIVA